MGVVIPVKQSAFERPDGLNVKVDVGSAVGRVMVLAVLVLLLPRLGPIDEEAEVDTPRIIKVSMSIIVTTATQTFIFSFPLILDPLLV